MRRLALTSLLASLLLSACAPTVILLTRQPPATPTQTPTPGPTDTPAPTPIPGAKLGIAPAALRDVSVTVWHGLDGASGALFAQMAAEFTLTNTWGVKVQVTSQNNMQLLGTSVDSALRTPQAPDLVLALPEQALAWDAQGAVTDLTPYLAQPEFGFSSAEIADFPSAFLNHAETNGKRLGVPAARTARFLFYNVSFAKALGFDTPPQTADDFHKQACAANASWKKDQDLTNDLYGGWLLDNPTTDTSAPWTAYAWLRASGGDVYSDGKYKFSTSENQAALNTLAGLHNDGCAWGDWQIPPSTTPTPVSHAQALANRQALFVSGSLDQLADERAAFAGSPDQWTVIPFPGKDPTIITYGPDYVILKSSEVRQLAAWLFVRWTLSPENQARWARETGLFPLRLSAVDQMQNIRTADPQWAAAVDLLPQAKTYPQAATWSKARQVLGDGFFALFQQSPSTDAATPVLAQMDATLQELLP
jgi:ABC-type glycerol-3-phosphate transport system substrate-binding protein